MKLCDRKIDPLDAEALASGTEPVLAADAAAHDVLVALYPALTSTLDAEFQQSLTLVPDRVGKPEGIRIGQAVAQAMLALRSNDGANDRFSTHGFNSGPNSRSA